MLDRALCLAVALILAAPAVAQDGWILTDDDEWVRDPSAPTAGPLYELGEARRALAEGRHDRARNLSSRWIDQYPEHTHVADAYLIRGDAIREGGDEYEALFDYELVARRYPGTEAFVTALERELDIADDYAAGMRRKQWGIRWVDASDEAEELYIRVQERLPGSELAERAALSLGDYYFRERRMALAAEMYAIFIENFPRSESVDMARLRLISAHLASFAGPEFDASGLLEARTLLSRMRASDPATAQQIGAAAIVGRIDESRARKLLTTAEWYLKRGDAVAAEFTARRLMKTLPRTVAADEAVHFVTRLMKTLPPYVRDEARDAGVYPPSVFGPEDDA